MKTDITLKSLRGTDAPGVTAIMNVFLLLSAVVTKAFLLEASKEALFAKPT